MTDQTRLTHFNERGDVQMVNVGEKPVTPRRAIVRGFVRCNEALLNRIRDNDLAKGNLLQIAQIAGVQAAKRTDELIPLCHSIPLDSVDVRLMIESNGVAIEAVVSASWRTGVEMEAFTAVMAAALTVIDMGKAVDKSMVIENVRLLEKSGGRSGTYRVASDMPARTT